MLGVRRDVNRFVSRVKKLFPLSEAYDEGVFRFRYCTTQFSNNLPVASNQYPSMLRQYVEAFSKYLTQTLRPLNRGEFRGILRLLLMI